MAKNNLNITALDFDDIKSSLKEYLKAQSTFKDYDFEGSGLNALLDILAYNTHYQAFYANMVANETFLDSATNRNSVISIAKHLNYIPKSYKSSIGYVDVEFLDSDLNTRIESGLVFINEGDRFITSVGNRTFMFLATGTTQVRKVGSQYFAKNVEIKEGIKKTISFVYSTDTTTNQKFVIPEINVDTDSIVVKIVNSTEDNTGIENTWSRVTDINRIDGGSRVYFIQQNSDLKYEIYFGDGIVGQNLSSGNVIIINYQIANGSIANELGKNDSESAPTFRYAENSKTKTSLVKDSNSKPTPTFGGGELETMESIKYYAPRNYQSQERAVTTEDYRTLLATQYGEQADSVFVWGGEDNDPPIYGKVFISIKPSGTNKLSQIEKLAISKNILKDHNLVTIIPEVVDPDYLYLLLTVTAKYDAAKTSLTADTLGSSIKSLLYDYTSKNIGKFDRNFNYSNYTSYIDSTFSPPVLSNTLEIQLQKRVEPNLSTPSSYIVNFDNALYHPVDGYSSILSSTGFGYQDSTSSTTPKPNVDCFLDDDGSGKVRIYKVENSTKVYINENIGTINYTTGKITLLNFAPQYLTSDSDVEIKLTAIPANKDIETRRNQIIIVEESGIVVNAVPQILRYDPYSASANSFTNNT